MVLQTVKVLLIETKESLTNKAITAYLFMQKLSRQRRINKGEADTS